MKKYSLVKLFIVIILLSPYVNLLPVLGDSYYNPQDLNSLCTQESVVATASPTFDEEIKVQISNSVQKIPYIRRIWDFYMENSEYDPANSTITGNIFVTVERLLTGKTIEVDLNERYLLKPTERKPLFDSRLYIGIEKVSLKLKYEF